MVDKIILYINMRFQETRMHGQLRQRFSPNQHHDVLCVCQPTSGGLICPSGMGMMATVVDDDGENLAGKALSMTVDDDLCGRIIE